MSEQVYNSNNERGLLRSVGPYRVATSDQSLAGVLRPFVYKATAPWLAGLIYKASQTSSQDRNNHGDEKPNK